jgi:hypothetical protein
MAALTAAASSTQISRMRLVQEMIAKSAEESGSNLFSPLIDIIMEYGIFDWTFQWVQDDSVCHFAFSKAGSLPACAVNLVVEYCKCEVFGWEELEKIAGEGDRERGKCVLAEQLKGYNPEPFLPWSVDEQMQVLLSQHFKKEDLRAFPGITRMGELYSVYCIPARMTPNIIEVIAEKYGLQLFDEHCSAEALKEHADTAITENCVILFPNDIFFRGKTVYEVLLSPGFRYPHMAEAVFCPLIKCIRTGIRILSEESRTYTPTQQEILWKGYKVKVGIGRFGDCGLHVCHVFRTDACVNTGVSLVQEVR